MKKIALAILTLIITQTCQLISMDTTNNDRLSWGLYTKLPLVIKKKIILGAINKPHFDQFVQKAITVCVDSSNRITDNLTVFTPDGSLALTAIDSSARLWSTQTGSAIKNFNHGQQEKITAIGMSNDGTIAFTGCSDGFFALWKIDDPKESKRLYAFKFEASAITCVSFSPDDSMILLGNKKGIARRVRTMTNTSQIKILDEYKHADAITSVAFSPDSSTLITGSHDTTAKMWDILTGHLVKTFNTNGPVHSVAFNRTATKILIGSSDATQLYNIQVEANRGEPKMLHGAPMWDLTDGYLKVTAHTVQSFNHKSPMTRAILSEDETKVYTQSSETKAFCWDAKTGELLQFSDIFMRLDANSTVGVTKHNNISYVIDKLLYRSLNDIAQLKPSARDGGYYAPEQQVARLRFMLLLADAYAKKKRLEIDPYGAHGNGGLLYLIYRHRFNADMQQKLSQFIYISSRRINKQKLSLLLCNTLNTVAFEPGGSLILIISDTHTADLWDADGAKPLYTLSHTNINSVDFWGKKIITHSTDGSIKTWDFSDKSNIQLLHTFC